MGKGVDGLAQDDAPEAVDIVRQPVAQQALVAEQVDQRDARQHRGRQQRQQGNAAPQALGRNQRALQGVGEQVGAGHHDGRDTEGNLQAVAQQPVEVGAGEQLAGRGHAAALPRVAAEAAPEDGQQRQQYRQGQHTEQQVLAALHEEPVAQVGAQVVPGRGFVQLDHGVHLRRTPAGCGTAGPPRYPGCPGAGGFPGPARPAADGPATAPARSSCGSGCRGR
ncbi:hypothetical protein D3C72_1276570 [compost metagenome]